MTYLCLKCGRQVVKAASMVALREWETAKMNEFIGLGKFKCSCGHTKVKAVKEKKDG